MEKRKWSSSKEDDRDSIIRKMKKLERQIKKMSKKSYSSESDYDSISDYNMNLSGEDIPDESTNYETVNIDDDQALAESHESTAADPGVPSAKPPVAPVAEVAQVMPVSDGTPLTLEPEILQLLGEDPARQKHFGGNLHNDIVQRWTHILVNGLSEDIRTEIVKRYLTPENCPYMRAPKLNLEIKAALSAINVKKDIYSQSKQNQLASSLVGIGHVLNWALTSKNTVPQEIIKTLGDSGRLICDSHYRESQSRRYAAMNTLNKNIQDSIKNTNIDEFLFGSNLLELIKVSRAISDTGPEMIPQLLGAPYNVNTATQPQRGALNLRGATRAAATETRQTPARSRTPRDRRRQDATRGHRFAGYMRQGRL